MNINPKKSWHVRSKTNIAKVRADEAKEEAGELEKKRRKDLARSDERWSYLRQAAKDKGFGGNEGDGGLDLFKDVKRGVDGVVAESTEHVKEKKADQEKWEKKIGLLKYLGEGSAEFSAEKPWWMKSKSGSGDIIEKTVELDRHSKSLEDPLADVNRSIKNANEGSAKVRSRSGSAVVVSPSPSSAPCKSIDQLRQERLLRERRERERTQALLANRGIIPMPKTNSAPVDERKRPYNSAFNPSISGHLRR